MAISYWEDAVMKMGYLDDNPVPAITVSSQTPYLTLLHSERPKLHRVLAFLSAIGLILNAAKMKVVVFANSEHSSEMAHTILNMI